LRALTGSSGSRSSREVADRVQTLRVPEPGTSVEKLGDCQRGNTPHMQGTDTCEGPKAKSVQTQTEEVLFAVFTTKASQYNTKC